MTHFPSIIFFDRLQLLSVSDLVIALVYLNCEIVYTFL